MAALAVTEPASDSNLLAIRTKGVASGNDFIVNRTQTLITGAGVADVVRHNGRTVKIGIFTLIVPKPLSLIGQPILKAILCPREQGKMNRKKPAKSERP